MRPFLLLILTTVSLVGPTRLLAQDDQPLQRELAKAKLAFEAGDEEQLLALITRFNGLSLDSAKQIDGKIDRSQWDAIYTNLRELEAEYWLRLADQDKADSLIHQIFDRNPSYLAGAIAPQWYKERVDAVRAARSTNLSYSASKKAEEAGMEPAFTMVITQEEMYARGYTHLEELFHDIPGISISNVKGVSYSALYQRGYRSSTGTDRTLLLIDGVEDNEIFTGLAYLSRQYPLTSIRQVEVVYGPSSTMYGANAFVGVINIITQAGSRTNMSPGKWKYHADLGSGTWNTRYADITVDKSWSQVQFSATGRVFQSDEMPLSGFERTDHFWDGEWGRSDLRAVYEKKYEEELSSDYEGDRPVTQADIDRMIVADSLAYHEARTPGYSTFSNTTNNAFVSASLSFGNFRFGAQSWTRQEGNSGGFTDNFFGISDSTGQWTVQHTFLTLQYAYQFNNALSLRTFTRYKLQANTPNARETYFSSFLSGGRKADELLSDPILPRNDLWSTFYYYQQASQLRTEASLLYTPSSVLDIIAGVEYRTTGAQANYLAAVNPFPESTGIVNSIPGGNLIRAQDLGVYAQASWKPTLEGLTMILGGRLDYNIVPSRRVEIEPRQLFGLDITQGSAPGGYGLVASPRLVALYQAPKRPLILKFIYARAFKDATNFNKFSTTNIRVANPTLLPEQSSNLEIIGRWKHTLTPETYWETEAGVYWGQFTNTPDLVTREDDTQRFETNEQSRTHVVGGQILGTLKLSQVSAWANTSLTFANQDTSIQVDDRPIRVGDIPYLQINLGGRYQPQALPWLLITLRSNYVGARKAGAGTTVNPEGTTLRTDPYLIFNGAITLKSPNHVLKGASVQFIGNNLLNTEYYHPGIRSADGIIFATQVPQERAHFMIRLRYQL